MKKSLYTLLGIIAGAGLMFTGSVIAKVVTVPDALSYVDFTQPIKDYPSVGKMYDSNANVVCYTLYIHDDLEANAISCVSLK